MLFAKSWSQLAAAALHELEWRHGSSEEGRVMAFCLPDEIGAHKGFCLGSDEQQHFVVYIFWNDTFKEDNFSNAVKLANALNHKLHFGSLEVTLDAPHQFVSKAAIFYTSASSAREQIKEAIRLCANNLGAHQMPIQSVASGYDYAKALKLYELACEAEAGSIHIPRTRNYCLLSERCVGFGASVIAPAISFLSIYDAFLTMNSLMLVMFAPESGTPL
jgi:hypothetical protein